MTPSEKSIIPPPNMHATRHVYKPRFRVWLDVVLVFAVAFIFFHMLGILRVNKTVLLVEVLTVTAFGGFFFLWVRPMFQIVIDHDKISGPSPGKWKRITLLMRQIDRTKILRRTRKQRFWGYRDLWSIGGERLRLSHRLLDKAAVSEILELVEKYPFHETRAIQVSGYAQREEPEHPKESGAVKRHEP